MLMDFQNSFTVGLSSKRVMKWSLKNPATTPHMRRYTTLWNVNVKKLARICWTINVKLIEMFRLIFVTVNIHNILQWLNAGMETPVPMVNDILNDVLFHSSPRINQTLHQILHVLHFCNLNSLLNYVLDFVVNWIEVRAVRRPQIWKFIGLTTISEIIALLKWRQRKMHKLFC